MLSVAQVFCMTFTICSGIFQLMIQIAQLLLGACCFLLEHCPLGWVENVAYVERASLLYDDVKNYVVTTDVISSEPLKNVAESYIS